MLRNTSYWIVIFVVSSQSLNAALPARIKSVVKNDIAPAYNEGRAVDVINLLSSIVGRLNDEMLLELDQELAEHGLSGAGEVLTECRIKTNAFLGPGKHPKLSHNELQLVYDAINLRVSETIALRTTQRAMRAGESRISDFMEFEKVLWNAHVFRNRLANAANLTVAAGKWDANSRVPRSNRANDVVAADDADYGALLNRLFEVRKELHERDLALKYQRLTYSLEILRDHESPTSRRLMAAYSVKKDGDLLFEVFKDKPKFEFATELNTTSVARTVREAPTRGRSLAGDQMVLAENLFDGLHWWFRGRYGRGSESGGLLKPKSAPQNLQQMVALEMPIRPPRPTAPVFKDDASDDYNNDYERSPDYDRRHHYIWSQEPPQFATDYFAGWFH